MPAPDETQSYQLLLNEIRNLRGMLEHVMTDVHALAERQDRVDRLLTEFEPIIRLYASPVSAYTAARHARKQRKGAPANG
jgi:hypothetical protein